MIASASPAVSAPLNPDLAAGAAWLGNTCSLSSLAMLARIVRSAHNPEALFALQGLWAYGLLAMKQAMLDGVCYFARTPAPHVEKGDFPRASVGPEYLPPSGRLQGDASAPSHI